MKLGTALGDSFKTYFKKPLLFSGIYVAAMLILIIFNLIILPSGALVALPLALTSGKIAAILSVAGLLLLLYIALAVVTEALSLGGLIKASAAVIAGHKTTIMDCLKFAFGLIKDYIILVLRVFWYSLAWVLILAMIILPLLGGLFNSAHAQAPSDMPANYNEMMQQLQDLQNTQGMQDVQGLQNKGFDSMASGNYGSLTPAYVANPLFAIIFLVLLVIVVYRLLQVAFAFYIFYDDPKMGTKKAMEESIKLMKGNMWRLIGYGIVFGLIIAIASGIITSVLFNPIAQALSSNFEGYFMWQTILGFILAAVVTPITILFYFVTYKGWTKEHGHHV